MYTVSHLEEPDDDILTMFNLIGEFVSNVNSYKV